VKAQITFLTRRARGGVSLKPSTVESDLLRIGRSTKSEVLLADVRVGLAEVEIRLLDDGLHIEQVGDNPLSVNGTQLGAARLKAKDEIVLGPYKLVIEEPPAGFDAALSVELVSALGDDFARLQAKTHVGLESTHLSKRRMSWALFALVFALFLALPIAAFFLNAKSDPRREANLGTPIPLFADVSWNPGEISNPHKNFADNCRACHTTPFVSVRDDACLTCHAAVPHHADPKTVHLAELDGTRCASCHEEHNGPRGTILQAEALCTGCHLKLKEKVPSTSLLDVGSFGRAHPQFRATIVADAAEKKLVRAALDAEPKPVDNPNIKFTHKEHLKPDGWPKGMKSLACADCHALEPGGAGILPISFEKHCASCHNNSLRFDPDTPNLMVPHGRPVEALRIVSDYYARVALEGGVKDPAAPEVVRRRPGEELPEEKRPEAIAWAKRKAAEIQAFVFDDKRGCGTCHMVERGGEAGYRIQPVLIQTHFMPKAQFNHAKHGTMACADCHAAIQSNRASDLLMPKIETCQRCHGGEKAGNRIQSTCISCHDFHRHDLGPMRTTSSDPQQTITAR
jgi:predicted CXXCH cytochrome family protein